MDLEERRHKRSGERDNAQPPGPTSTTALRLTTRLCPPIPTLIFPANFSEDLTDSLSGLGLTGNDSLASGVQDFATTITDAGKQLLGGLTDAIQG